MRVEHLGTKEADSIRAYQLSGTTSAGSTKHAVFHIDKDRGYALFKTPGSSYSNRSVNHYVSGHIDLIWLSRKERYHRVEVWSTSRDEDGTLTPARADELVAVINGEIDSCCTAEEFAAECAANPGEPVNVVRLKVGHAYEFMGKRCLMESLRNGPKCVLHLGGNGYKVDGKYESTSEEYEEQKREEKRKAKEEADVKFAEDWMLCFRHATHENQIEMVLKLAGKK